MHFLIRAAMLLAAGAAGWALAKRRAKPEENSDPHVVYLEDDEAVIDAQDSAEPASARAEVLHCFRRMDPLTLNGASEVTFCLDDGAEVKFSISGEGGFHLAQGDQGLLTWSDKTLIHFEKDNGEVIGSMFYMPAQEETDNE